MKALDTETKEFLQKHKIAVLTVLMEDQNPHSATIHYAMNEEPLFFVFLTGKESIKYQSLSHKIKVPASLVIGFSDEEWITVQMRGTAKIATETKEIDDAWRIYMTKFPGMDTPKAKPSSAALIFHPTWWRYSKMKPEFIVESSE